MTVYEITLKDNDTWKSTVYQLAYRNLPERVKEFLREHKNCAMVVLPGVEHSLTVQPV